ncbi:DUF3313 domain-containing protein [Acerihabitans sp. KWT182]|uniref:DUF3313 domain-containing protein n=1 Tax=Acerihabitans sp. KWT182 TaxID=3157919 RepID=A0AAU7QB17_9GAMM
MNNKKRFIIKILLAAGLVLTGCSSKVAEQKQFSGFLGDYSTLQVADSPSGHKVLRWIAPGFKESDFRGVYFAPLIFYPPAHPNTRISQDTLNQIRQYASGQIRNAIAERSTLLDSSSGSRVLVAQVAITAVTAENEDMKFYEVVPVAAVIASTMAASGHRTQNATLFIEAKLIDQDTGKTVFAVVRKGYGRNVRNNSAPITADDVKPVIDAMVADIVHFPKQ